MPIWGRHKVMVFLPRRGGRRLLKTLMVRDVDEVEERVLQSLEEYANDTEIKQYKYVIALDTKTNTEVKIDNPYFDEGLAQPRMQAPKQVTVQDLKEAAQLELIDSVLSTYRTVIPQLISSLTTSTVEVIRDSVKRIMEEEAGRGKLRDLGTLVMGLVEMAKNWDKVKKMLKEGLPEVARKLMAAQMGAETKSEGKTEGKKEVKGEGK